MEHADRATKPFHGSIVFWRPTANDEANARSALPTNFVNSLGICQGMTLVASFIRGVSQVLQVLSLVSEILTTANFYRNQGDSLTSISRFSCNVVCDSPCQRPCAIVR